MSSKNYTSGSIRLLAAGITNGYELSTEAQRTTGQALADYAAMIDKFSVRGKSGAASANKIISTQLKMDPASIKNRERAARWRQKKASEVD